MTRYLDSETISKIEAAAETAQEEIDELVGKVSTDEAEVVTKRKTRDDAKEEAAKAKAKADALKRPAGSIRDRLKAADAIRSEAKKASDDGKYALAYWLVMPGGKLDKAIQADPPILDPGDLRQQVDAARKAQEDAEKALADREKELKEAENKLARRPGQARRSPEKVRRQRPGKGRRAQSDHRQSRLGGKNHARISRARRLRRGNRTRPQADRGSGDQHRRLPRRDRARADQTAHGHQLRRISAPVRRRLRPGQILPYAVKAFFDNGGRRAYIARIVGDLPVGDTGMSEAALDTFTVRANGPGTASDRIWARIDPGTTKKSDGTPVGFRLRVFYWDRPPAGRFHSIRSIR